MKRSAGLPELLDGPLEPALLEGNLRDLERVNRWLGGHSLSWAALRQVVDGLPAERPLRLLDIGTGAGDFPLTFAERSRRECRRLTVVATEIRPEIAQAAARRLEGATDIELRLTPPTGLDEPDRSFDIVHLSLVLHHLDRPAAAQLLAETARLAACAVIVNDLYRRWHAWLGAWLLTRLATRNRYTRNDGPLSVRRAYQPWEVAALGRGSGLRPERLLREPLGHRYALVLRPVGQAHQ